MSNKLLATSSSCPAPSSAFGLTLTPSTTPNLRDSACSLALPFRPRPQLSFSLTLQLCCHAGGLFSKHTMRLRIFLYSLILLNLQWMWGLKIILLEINMSQQASWRECVNQRRAKLLHSLYPGLIIFKFNCTAKYNSTYV